VRSVNHAQGGRHIDQRFDGKGLWGQLILQQSVDGGIQVVGLHGLGHISIHPHRKAAFLIALHGVGGYGDDGNMPVAHALLGPDRGSGLEAVELRHLDIHQYQIAGIGSLPARGVREALDAKSGCGRDRSGRHDARKECLRGRQVVPLKGRDSAYLG